MTEYYYTQSLATAAAAIEQGFWACESFASLLKLEELSDNIKDIATKQLHEIKHYEILSTRTLRCFCNNHIFTMSDLLSRDAGYLLRMPNFGRKSLHEVMAFLEKNGLELATLWEDWTSGFCPNADKWRFPRTPHNVALWKQMQTYTPVWDKEEKC